MCNGLVKIYKEKGMGKKNIKWGSIVPLLGGMSIGNYKAIEEYHGVKVPPMVFYSYKAFKKNDEHCLNYFNNTLEYETIPYIVLDDEEMVTQLYEDLDFVSAVPPCAGLSQLNCGGSKNADKKRGSCAVQNEWMYRSSTFVLSQLKPKVLMGENAPGLFTKLGEGVRQNLMEIAKKHGYSITFYKTNTLLHGVPQSRIRTFYVFWRSDTAPIMNWYSKEYQPLYDYIKDIPKDTPHYDTYMFNNQELKNNDEYIFMKETFGDKWREVIGDSKTIFGYIITNNKFDEIYQWAEKNGKEKLMKTIDRIKYKLSLGKGFWDSSPVPVYEKINAVVGRNLTSTVHPKEDRYFNKREFMKLMGLPDDFVLVNKFDNHIAQNVPVNTAKDITLEILKFINGDLEMSDNSFVMQDNLKQKITFID